MCRFVQGGYLIECVGFVMCVCGFCKVWDCVCVGLYRVGI